MSYKLNHFLENTVGLQIHQAHVKKKYTQIDTAQKLNMNKSNYVSYKRGTSIKNNSELILLGTKFN